MSEQPVVIEGIRPGLAVRTVTGCGDRKVTVADWLCACGHHEHAQGNDEVRSLCERVIVGICPHATTTKEAA